VLPVDVTSAVIVVESAIANDAALATIVVFVTTGGVATVTVTLPEEFEKFPVETYAAVNVCEPVGRADPFTRKFTLPFVPDAATLAVASKLFSAVSVTAPVGDFVPLAGAISTVRVIVPVVSKPVWLAVIVVVVFTLTGPATVTVAELPEFHSVAR
jgi:hypothetical protein